MEVNSNLRQNRQDSRFDRRSDRDRVQDLDKKKRRQRQQIFQIEDEIMEKRDMLLHRRGLLVRAQYNRVTTGEKKLIDNIRQSAVQSQIEISLVPTFPRGNAYPEWVVADADRARFGEYQKITWNTKGYMGSHGGPWEPETQIYGALVQA